MSPDAYPRLAAYLLDVERGERGMLLVICLALVICCTVTLAIHIKREREALNILSGVFWVSLLVALLQKATFQ